MLNAINQQMQRNIAQPRRGVTTIEVGGPCRLGWNIQIWFWGLVAGTPL